MGCYLDWLEAAHPAGHVRAPGDGFWSRRQRVKQIFSLLLLFAAIFSFVLILV
jgi:hypothetical protein